MVELVLLLLPLSWLRIIVELLLLVADDLLLAAVELRSHLLLVLFGTLFFFVLFVVLDLGPGDRLFLTTLGDFTFESLFTDECSSSVDEEEEMEEDEFLDDSPEDNK